MAGHALRAVERSFRICRGFMPDLKRAIAQSRPTDRRLRQLSTCKAGCIVPGRPISIASFATLAGSVRQGKARTAYASLLLPALVGDSDLAFGAHA